MLLRSPSGKSNGAAGVRNWLVTGLLGAGALAALGACWLRYLKLPQGPSRLGWDRLVFGHRGCTHVPGVPENTLEAFRYAAMNGAAGVELDVKVSQDNEIICMHDGFVSPSLNDPVTQADPMVKRRTMHVTLSDIKTLTYRDDATGAARVPTLEEAVLFCKEHHLKILIEVKVKLGGVMVPKLLELYAKYGEEYMYEHTTVICFWSHLLYQLRKKDPKIAVCQLYTDKIIYTWKFIANDVCPRILYWLPTKPMDMLLNFVQSKISPWLIGVSMMGPKRALYDESVQQRWLDRGVVTFLWGFDHTKSPQELLSPSMRKEGNLIAVDNRYASYAVALAHHQ